MKQVKMLATLINLLVIFGIALGASRKFPSDFKFGVATSSYQTEGAAFTAGKGESIWDYYTHNFPDRIVDGSNGDVACDSYHKVDVDIANLKKLGVHFYRMSISWTRLLPTGFTNYINPDGVRYYNELIDSLLAEGIEPWITLYHWDLPQSIQDLGGWPNKQTADYFADYARVCFRLFGDRVKTWMTFNEPYNVCAFSYERGVLAPDILSPGIGSYQCGHTLLLGHAKVYDIYAKNFRQRQRGKVGIVLESPWFEPSPETAANVGAANRATQARFLWFLHPIFSRQGDYHPELRRRIDFYSKRQNYVPSRLPQFTKPEVDLLRGSADFLGLNHYTTFLVRNGDNSMPQTPSLENDTNVFLFQSPDWEVGARDEFRTVPFGIRKLLGYIATEYRNPLVYISESGYAGFQNETFDDSARIRYYSGYLKEILRAMEDYHSNVKAFTAWSFMDNFEWSQGYTMRFGLYHVNFTSPDRTRSPKKSAYFYQNTIRTGEVNENFVENLSTL